MKLKNKKILIYLLVSFCYASIANASCEDCQCDNCCGQMGGIQYCDSSAGRYVCNNGDYSTCYCTIHAIMDLQKLQGCCLWEGGVAKVTENGVVMCRDCSYS